VRRLAQGLVAGALAASLLAFAPAAALAQQMPDARQMSGTPRPDREVPNGTVTVRVVHGEMSKLAAAGTLVHLVALHPDGKIDRMTRPVDNQGRATFEKLTDDGTVSYYAYTFLDGDRLESEIITLDRMSGIRLALAGRKLDANGAPIGTPVDDAASPDDPMKQPPGEVWVAVGGRGMAVGTPVELVEVPEVGQAAPAPRTTTAADGGQNQFVARFTDVAGDASKVYLARVKLGSRYFNSKPFMLPPGMGAGRRILVIDQIIPTMHMAAEVDDTQLRVQARYMLQNFVGGPWDPGPEGLPLPLPVGSTGAQTADESGRVKIDPGKSILWKGVLPPGQTELDTAYGMPITDGTATFVMNAPLGLFQSTLVVEHTAGSAITAVSVEVPAGARAVPAIPMPEKESDTGRKFYVAENVTVPAGATLRFTVSGLPQHPASQRIGRTLAGLAVLLMIVAALAVTIFDPFGKRAAARAAGAKPAEGGRSGASRRKELTTRKEQLFDELVALERKRAAQQIDEDRYELGRQSVVSKLTLVLRELDQLDAAAATRAS
jgi:hypothetical protein